MGAALLELSVPGGREPDIVQLGLEVVGGDALSFFIAVGEVTFRSGWYAAFLHGDIFEGDALDAAGGKLGAEEVADVGFCCIDWDVDDEEAARRVWVWDSGFVRAEVEVVRCWCFDGLCGGELQWKGGVPGHFHGVFLHSWGWLLACGVSWNFFEVLRLAWNFAAWGGRLCGR